MEHPLFEQLSPRRRADRGAAALTWPASTALHLAGLSLLVVAPALNVGALPEIATPVRPPDRDSVRISAALLGSRSRAPAPPSRPAAGPHLERAATTPPARAPVAVPDGLPDTADWPGDTMLCADCVPGFGSGPGDPDGHPDGVPWGAIGVPPPSEPITPVRAHVDVEPPRKLHDVKPLYPELARLARIEGIVILECVIGPDGRVATATVLRGHPVLDPAALTAVLRWRYTPTLLRGVPVPVIMTATVRFSLER